MPITQTTQVHTRLRGTAARIILLSALCFGAVAQAAQAAQLTCTPGEITSIKFTEDNNGMVPLPHRLIPAFDKATTRYTGLRLQSTQFLYITAEVCGEDAMITWTHDYGGGATATVAGGEISRSIAWHRLGDGVVTAVTAVDSATKTYTFNFLSVRNFATLSNLQVADTSGSGTGFVLEPGFNKNHDAYTLTLPATNNGSFRIKATQFVPSENGLRITNRTTNTVLHPFAVPGANPPTHGSVSSGRFSLPVTLSAQGLEAVMEIFSGPEDEDSGSRLNTVATIRVIRAASTIPAFTGITFTDGPGGATLAFASNPDFTSIGTLTARTYTISGVLGFSKELHVTAHVIAGGPGSARVVNGNQLNLGTATPIGFTPPVGTSLIGIDRTAPDGVSKARYLFRITRAAAVGTDSRLSALSLTRSGGGALTTDPGFNPDTLLYTVNEELPVGESAFKITATASVGATLRIVGRSAALASGVATSVDGLQRGSNRVQLESISETGVISVYTIIIKRASAPAPVAPRVQPDPPTTMRALHLVSFEMVNSTDTSVALVVFPNFHPGRTDYTVDWPLGAVSGNAQIRAKPNSSATNVSVRVHEFPNNDLGGGFTELSGGSYCTNLFRPSPPSCFLSPTALSAKFSIPQGGVRRIVIEVKGSRFGPGATYYTFVTRSAAPPPPVPPTPPTPPSSNAALSSLVVKDSGNNALVFDRIFDATAFSYSTVVAFSQRHVTVTAELADANASMTINGASLDSGATSGQIALQSGQANVLRLVTSAEDRLTGAVYTLTITRTGQMEDLVPTTPTTPVTPGLSADATLRSFRMVYDGFNKELIDGANFRNVNRVNETVPDQLVRVIAVPTHPAATMALSGNAVPSAGALARGAMSALLRSGSASEVILTVTAPSGATRQYIINLRHKVGDINTLSSIGVWSCERIGDSESACQPGTITSVAAVADPTFVPGATNVSAYTIVLPHGTPNNILFTARPTHQFASAAITGTLAPTPSDNGPPYAISDTMRSYPLTLLGGDTATLRVVAENGVAARNYLLTISAPARPRAMLTITPNDGLGKEFGADDPATLGFSAAFPSGDFNTIASVFSAAPFDRAPGEAVGTYDYRLNVRFRLNKFAQEYTLVLASGNVFTIRPKPLTITDSSANKVYDGNTSLPGGFAPAISGAVKKTLNGVDIDDTGPANLFVRDCVFANKNVGANKATTGCALSGPKSGNYILTANITGNISERPTTVTGSAYTTIARIYDGTTDLTSEIIPFFNPPLIQDDIVSLTGGMFADENAGSDKAITGFTLGGADIANYAVTVGAVRADIGHRALRVTASGRAENNPPSPTDRSLLVVATDRVDEGEGLLSGHTVNDVFIGALELGTRTPATGAGTQPLLQGTLTTSASPPGSNYELVEFTDGVFHYDGLPEPPQTAPGSFAATAREEKAFLSWTALDPDPTPPVLNYRLRWRIVGSGSAGWNNNGNGVAIDVDTLAYTATGLTNDREYEFEVAAVSRTGVGVHASARATPDLDETDNTLKALFSQAHMRVLPAFSKDITEYRLVGRYSVFTGLSVRATAESAHASVVVSATNQVSFVPRQDTGDDITADLNCGRRNTVSHAISPSEMRRLRTRWS